MIKKIISPCISICKTDPVTGFCYGCARTDKEKKLWKEDEASNEWKSKNLDSIISRMKGWQLNTFKESYDHKINNGISLFKKKLLEKNKL
ncbi:MAG: hypothetical protein FD550_000390 [Pelagibacterales bacterium]|jgi:predicted Fe-S protein YdhL (DUF1289 family)|nr:hypothetical protein [Pelagibacterales bacterium]